MLWHTKFRTEADPNKVWIVSIKCIEPQQHDCKIPGIESQNWNTTSKNRLAAPKRQIWSVTRNMKHQIFQNNLWRSTCPDVYVVPNGMLTYSVLFTIANEWQSFIRALYVWIDKSVLESRTILGIWVPKIMEFYRFVYINC